MATERIQRRIERLLDQIEQEADDRYEIKRFLGEGGKKKVYLAQDTLLDLEVAFALIKAEGLGRRLPHAHHQRGPRHGRLGSHPHIVTCLTWGNGVAGYS